MKQKNWIVGIGALLLSILFSQTVFAEEKPVNNSVTNSVKFNDTMNAIQDEALFKMNEYRGKLGLPLFNKNLLIQKASQSHGNYLSINNEFSHYQTKNNPGFTGAGPSDRAKYFGYEYRAYTEGIGHGATGIEGINMLMDAPYHRASIINPRYVDAGTGYNERGDLVVNYGNSEYLQVPKDHEVVVYPYANQKDVKTSWLALESPNPLRFWGIESEDFEVVGYPISFLYADGYFSSNQLGVEKITLTDDSGKAIPFYDVTPERDPDENQNVFIIPKQELAAGMTYYVSVDAYVGDSEGKKQDISREWSFTTMEDVTVTDVFFRGYDDYPNELEVEINNGAYVSYELALKRNNHVYLQGKKYNSEKGKPMSPVVDMYDQHVKKTLVPGKYELNVTIPELKKELKLPVTLQKKKEKFYNDSGDWQVTFDKQGKDTEVSSWLFHDVKQNNSHRDGIHYLTNKGVINGYGDDTFGPDNSITRSQAATLFTREMNLQTPSNVSNVLKNYSDITTKHDHAHAIAATYEAGIFKGNNGRFNDGSLTREQMATVLVNAYGLKDNGKQVNAKLSNIDPSHKENVKILFQHDITVETGDFRPRHAVTRGQFATFLYRVTQLK